MTGGTPLAGVLGRRALLRAAAVAALGRVGFRTAVGAAAATAAAVVSRQQASAAGPFATPLRLPPVLTAPHVTLVAREALVQVLPGMPTRMWTFNGSFPGPVIKRPSGRPTRVTVKHRLPRSVGSLTIHHHGAHAASAEDGQPERNVIQPGRERTYTYGLVEDGKPERGATQWYHDHSHYRTLRNVWHGLAGFFLVEDGVDRRLGLPVDAFDIPLMLTERSFDSSNQLLEPAFRVYSETDGANPLGLVSQGDAPNDDVTGTRFLVNGVENPYLEVAARRYRFRILNTSPYRPYNLRLSDGGPMVQVATESGLLPRPVSRTEILIGPGERVEVVVDFSRRAGRRLTLDSVARTSTVPLGLVTSPAESSFLELRVTRRARETSKVPAALRPLPAWVATASREPHRVWVFGAGVDAKGRGAWTINGQAFDHHRVDAHPELGSVETWLLVNASPRTVSHYIHIHDIDWKVLERNGSAPEPGEDCLKETFRLDPGEVLIVAGKFTDHLGHYMLHCHMLNHEDHGMMTVFDVVPPGQGDAPVRPGLEAALAASVADPVVRDRVRRIVRAARGGQPAPASVLPSSDEAKATSLAQLLRSDPDWTCRP